jgi:hypothetical protein
MKNYRRLSYLIAGGACTLALAAPDLGPVTQATATVNDCARVANEIAATPVPAGHAEASLAASTNTQVTDAKQKLTVAPEHAQFAQRMQGDSARLDACGKNVNPAIKAAQDHLARVAKAGNLTQQDVAAIQPAMGALAKAQDDLRAAVEKLTQDKIKQSYLSGPINNHFLKAAKP